MPRCCSSSGRRATEALQVPGPSSSSWDPIRLQKPMVATRARTRLTFSANCSAGMEKAGLSLLMPDCTFACALAYPKAGSHYRVHASIRAHSGFLHQRAPFCELVVHVGAKLLRRAAADVDSLLGEVFLHVRHCQDFADFAVELVDDFARRAGGYSEAEPGHRLEAWQSGLSDCRNIRQKCRALLAGDSESAHAPGFDLRQRGRGDREQRVNLSAAQRGGRLRAAFVRYVYDVDVGAPTEQFASHLR